MVYSYFRGFNEAWNKNQPDIYEVSQAESAKVRVRPFFLGESTYEGEHGEWGSALPARKQAWWCVLGGGFGHAYGSPNWNMPGNWREVLELPGASSLKHLRSLLESKAWWQLVPDVDNVVAVDGRGTFAMNDYAVTALATDASFALSYLPTKLALTIDLSKFSQGKVEGSWFNPRTGETTRIGEFTEKKKQVFEPPAEGDWLLVIGSEMRSNSAAETEEKGRINLTPPQVPAEFSNEWPPAWEAAFQDRVKASLRASDVQPGKYGGTYFENEKASYPQAFIGFLKGQRAESLKFLQQEDDAAWSKKLTLGVDWFPSFTIRSQVRKYFLFGPYFDPEYRRRMFDSARIWTEKDPLGRPNEFWIPPAQRKSQAEGWTPEYQNSWVDVRGTDNLRAMRETAVYLMSEETGNAETAKTYKERIRAYVTALYTTGMGEWDSANYLSHGLTAYLNLYDFARDTEVRSLAKAHLDWICTAAAVKYFRGCWAGPNIRDYGNIGAHDGAAGEFWHYFGGWEEPAAKPYRDFVHIATSGYRPPAAVVELARKNFPRPVEMLASKPSYDGWTKPGGESEPTYFETTWIAHHTQLGSLPNGHADRPGMNLNGFRLLAENSTRGADTLIIFTSLDYNQSHASATAGGDQIGQFRGKLMWLNAKSATPFFLFLPRSAEIVEEGERIFIRLEKTWLALHLINAKPNGVDSVATQRVCAGRKPYPADQVWSANGGNGACGVAIEIGEPESHADFATFRNAVSEKSKLDLAKLGEGEAHLTGSDGDRVGLRLTREGRPIVFRNGAEHDWKQHWPLWSGGDSPVTLGWKEGELHVKAGGREFSSTLRNGRCLFENR
jgi:hypothetical protein